MASVKGVFFKFILFLANWKITIKYCVKNMFTPSPLVWCSHSLFRNSVLFVKRVWVANKEKTYLSLARQLNNNWWFEFQFGKNAIVIIIIIIVILPSLKTGIYDYIFTVLRICESDRDICVPVILAWPGAIGIHVETFMDFFEHTTNCIL